MKTETQLNSMYYIEMINHWAAIRGFTFGDIRGKCRRKRLVAARHELARMLRDQYDLSLPEIGGLLNRDHTTILYAVRKGETC
jgi:chromosomal replication initiation ATPase DnaA